MASQHETRTGNGKGKVVSLRKQPNLRPVLPIYWSDADSGALRLAVDAVTRYGAAILCGRTQDGGALSICILDQDSKIKEYPHSVDELAAVLRAIAEEYTDALL
jgi:hypothetical protein